MRLFRLVWRHFQFGLSGLSHYHRKLPRIRAAHSFILCKWAKWAAQKYIHTTYFKTDWPMSCANATRNKWQFSIRWKKAQQTALLRFTKLIGNFGRNIYQFSNRWLGSNFRVWPTCKPKIASLSIHQGARWWAQIGECEVKKHNFALLYFEYSGFQTVIFQLLSNFL